MNKTIFGIDEIHALRIELADRRSKMSQEDARRDFAERVDRGRRAIEKARSSSAEPRQG